MASKNCVMCGKEITLLDKLSIRKLLIPDKIGEENVCGECGKMLNIFIKVNLTVSGFANVSKDPKLAAQNLNEYRTNITNRYDLICSKIPTEEVRRKFDELVADADRIRDSQVNFADFLDDVSDVIYQEQKCLPPNQMNCGYSTFAVSEDTLYYMKYGKPLIKNSSFLQISNGGEKWDLMKKLRKNVLDKSDLIVAINLEDIIFFQEKGDLKYSTSISGGGSKGVSYGNAVLGGLLFGPTGAIVGGMSGNKVEDISSEIVQHDDRYVVIKYRDSSGRIVEKKASYDYYNVFSNLIPQKEYSYIQINTSSKEKVEKKETEGKHSSINVEELKSLKELYDIGVITKEEFDAKKKQLLGL